MRSRREERMVTIALPGRGAGPGGGDLEGIFIAGAAGSNRGAVVAPPHPLFGGSIESPVLNEIAYACTKTGIASLRFNWRGVGASTGVPSGDAADAEVDYRAALTHMGETVDGPIVACGYSFGAAAAVRVALERPASRSAGPGRPAARHASARRLRAARATCAGAGRRVRFPGGAGPVARAHREPRAVSSSR